jgi:hypothetical protein
MSKAQTDSRNCFLCRMMRGMAFGGLGAALLGLPARWLGANQTEIIYAALFGALLANLLFNRSIKKIAKP